MLILVPLLTLSDCMESHGLCIDSVHFQGVQGPVSGHPGTGGLHHLSHPLLRADQQARLQADGDPECQHDGAGAVLRHHPGHRRRHDADTAAKVR